MADAFGAPPPRRVPAWLMRLVAPYVAFCAIDTSMRVANTKAKRELGWQPAYPTYQEGINAMVGRPKFDLGRPSLSERHGTPWMPGEASSPAQRSRPQSARGNRCAGQTAVVPGAVEPFVGEGGDGAQLGEQRRPAQHPVGVVGVQPHALPLQVGQRSVVGRSCRSPASASAWAHPVA